MQCNIDPQGRRIRLIIGVVSVLAGVVLAALLMAGVMASPWLWLAVAGCILGGAFAIFEARMGWCAARAVGIKTPW